jgi:hypothetical protein
MANAWIALAGTLVGAAVGVVSAVVLQRTNGTCSSLSDGMRSAQRHMLVFLRMPMHIFFRFAT